MDTQQLLQKALVCYQDNRLEQTREQLLALLAILPDHARAHHILGITLTRLGEQTAGLEHLQRAIELKPDEAEFRYNLAIFYQRCGALQDAVDVLNKLIDSVPGHDPAYRTKAQCLMGIGEIDKALDSYQQRLTLNPDNACAYNDYGIAQQKLRKHSLAEESYRKAVALDSNYAEAWCNLASVLGETDRPDESITAADQAMLCKPDLHEAYYNKATALTQLGKNTEALAVYDALLLVHPGLARAHNQRGAILAGTGRVSEAIAEHETALKITPDDVDTYNQLGKILMNSGDHESAIECFKKTLSIQPDFLKAYSNLLFILAYYPDTGNTRSDYFRYAGRWSELLNQHRTRPKAVQHRSRNKRIRIGYVSPDLHTHVVSFFLLPLLEAHDQTQVDIFCYNCSDKPADKTTEKLKKASEHWRNVTFLEGEKLAQLIIDDGIDILVDLSGHTSHNRLAMFSYRPAPIQVSYLGYFASTGLPDIDYWMSDNVLHPSSSSEKTVEKIYRLPRCWVCYQPPVSAPEVSPCPDSGNGVMLASFTHSLSKMNKELVTTWSEILRRIPDSRLTMMCKPLIDTDLRDRIVSMFSDHGIGAERLELKPSVDLEQYLATYSSIDIVLDTFPRTGGTTTAEALWMGVPVVTLAGNTYVERISASKLHAIGLETLICETRDEYIEKVVSLAQDALLRKHLRSELRNMMRNSPLCDGEGLARVVESAYRDMCSKAGIRIR